MPSFPRAAAVLYAKDIAKVGNFYSKVAGLRVAYEEQGHIVLESEALQRVVIAVPPEAAASIHIT